MNTNVTRRTGIVAVLTALLFAPAVHANTPQTPSLRQVGATAVAYRGDDLQVALSYRFAQANSGERWLLLDVGMTTDGAPVEVARKAISVRTPAGQVVHLSSEQAFMADYGALAPMIARASVAREPLNYFTPKRVATLPFFAVPGTGLAFPSVWLDAWHNTYGQLYFRIPDGVRPGRWELRLDLPEREVTIPFTI